MMFSPETQSADNPWWLRVVRVGELNRLSDGFQWLRMAERVQIRTYAAVEKRSASLSQSATRFHLGKSGPPTLAIYPQVFPAESARDFCRCSPRDD